MSCWKKTHEPEKIGPRKSRTTEDRGSGPDGGLDHPDRPGSDGRSDVRLTQLKTDDRTDWKDGRYGEQPNAGRERTERTDLNKITTDR
ncbi:hypothetical protein quinque_010282 [Culex quinquefasciatus]